MPSIALSTWLISFCLITMPINSIAQAIDFEAKFNTRLMGIHVGTVSQNMSCIDGLCTLKNQAIPPGWAKLFINESSIETIKLHYHQDHLEWLHYHKELERRYSDRTKHITVDIKADREKDQIISVQEKLTWPYHPHAYDMISIVHALRFYVQQNQTIPALVLQEEREQNPVDFKVQNQKTTTHTGFKSDLSARYFEWDTQRQHIKIWLLEDYDMFPGRIDFYNKQHDRRVVLVLEQPPHFNKSS